MPNSHKSPRTNTQKASVNENTSESKSLTSARGNANPVPSTGFDGENLLDQFSTFMKANWRPLLMEAVAAGVTAYMTYAANGGNKSNKTHN